MCKLIEKVGDERKEIDPARQGGIGEVPYQSGEPEPEGFLARLKHPERSTSEVSSTTALDAFLTEAGRTGANLLHLDRSLTTQQLEERIRILDRLCFVYQHQHGNGRNAEFIKNALTAQFNIPTIPKEVEAELSQLESRCHKKGGAENKNIFYRKNGKYPAVLKITKERHDDDFYSVLKLMRNMHVMALRLNRDVPGEAFRAEVAFEDMAVYRDEHDKFKRIIRQPYASGTPVQQLPDAVRQSPAYQRSWKKFLAYLRSMEQSDGVVLDVTDSSRAGLNPERGKVNNTENVFVREEGGRYVFTVIDLDVFDTSDGEHKFSPQEHLRFGQRSFGALKNYVVAAVTNAGRKWVEFWQNRSLHRGGR